MAAGTGIEKEYLARPDTRGHALARPDCATSLFKTLKEERKRKEEERGRKKKKEKERRRKKKKEQRRRETKKREVAIR